MVTLQFDLTVLDGTACTTLLLGEIRKLAECGVRSQPSVAWLRRSPACPDASHAAGRSILESRLAPLVQSVVTHCALASMRR